MADYRVILVEPQFEESIGYIARAMKNFGLSSLHLVNPIATLGDNGRMRAGHAQDVLDSLTVHPTLREALDGVALAVGTTAQKALSASNLVRKPMTVKELRSALQGQAGTVGIVLGREGKGLNNSELSQCDSIVTIPTASEYQTLNLSHAAAIVFYELHNSTLPTPGDRLATQDAKATILRYLSESASLAGVEEYRVGLTIRALRNVLGRSALRWREGSLLAGALRQIADVLSGLGKTTSATEIREMV